MPILSKISVSVIGCSKQDAIQLEKINVIPINSFAFELPFAEIMRLPAKHFNLKETKGK